MNTLKGTAIITIIITHFPTCLKHLHLLAERRFVVKKTRAVISSLFFSFFFCLIFANCRDFFRCACVRTVPSSVQLSQVNIQMNAVDVSKHPLSKYFNVHVADRTTEGAHMTFSIPDKRQTKASEVHMVTASLYVICH